MYIREVVKRNLLKEDRLDQECRAVKATQDNTHYFGIPNGRRLILFSDAKIWDNTEYSIFDILKFILGSEAWGNKTKEMYHSLSSLKMISFVLFLKSHSQVRILIHRNWSFSLCA